MLTAEGLEIRREEIRKAPDLAALLARIAERNQRLLSQPPEIPVVKALLSADGGVCPEHGTALEFDPWSPRDHRCRRCGRAYRGERHDRAWARWQHLWLAELPAGHSHDVLDPRWAALARLAGRAESQNRRPDDVHDDLEA